MEEVLSESESRMDQTVDAIRRELGSVRTGRANLHILDGVEVDAYGSKMPLNQVATLTIQDAQTLAVKPFDISIIGNVEKAIQVADLGLNPMNDGKLLRIPIPPLTEERRKQLARRVGEIREEGKIALRSIRHHAREEIKKLEQSKEISEDQEHTAYDRIQKFVDKHVATIDQIADAKEQEVLEI